MAIARELREKTWKDFLVHDLGCIFDVSLWRTLRSANLQGEVQQLTPLEVSVTAENYQGKM